MHIKTYFVIKFKKINWAGFFTLFRIRIRMDLGLLLIQIRMDPGFSPIRMQIWVLKVQIRNIFIGSGFGSGFFLI